MTIDGNRQDKACGRSDRPTDPSADASLAGKVGRSRAGARPEWANGLRQLYDAVIEEPLPDSFKDLLSQLDAKA